MDSPAAGQRRGAARRNCDSVDVDRRRRASSTDGELTLRLPDSRHRRDARLLRPRRVAHARARPEDARGRAGDPPARAARIRARRTRDRSARRSALLTFVVVGGGPTGVELAGRARGDRPAVARARLPPFRSGFRARHPDRGRAPRSWRRSPSRCGEAAQAHLEQLGVEVRTNSIVTRVVAGGVETPVSELISRGDCAVGRRRRGVAARRDAWRAARPRRTRLGRARPHDSRTSRRSSSSAISRRLPAQNGKPLPGVAQVAIQMGSARCPQYPTRDLRGSRMRPFKYTDLGNMATIGRASGGRGLRLAAAARLDRLAGLAVRPHPQSHRLSEPAGRARAVGVGVLHLSAIGVVSSPGTNLTPAPRRDVARRPRALCRGGRGPRPVDPARVGALVFARFLSARCRRVVTPL